MTRPIVTRIVLSVFMAAFILVACNNNKKEEKKEGTTDTTKMEQPMDTGSTKPVKEGN